MDKNKLIKDQGIRLDLAYSSNKRQHWIGLGIRDLHGVDILWVRFRHN